jgi:hypothetical protein
LVLEPYLHGCGLERAAELDKIVSLFSEAGYNVTYKCRNSTRCPQGRCPLHQVSPRSGVPGQANWGCWPWPPAGCS